MNDFYESQDHHYRLTGFQAATEDIDDDFVQATLSDDMFVPLSAHHTSDGQNSYLLFFDRAAIWSPPGKAEYVAFHITKNLEQRTFDFTFKRAPVLPLAQNWLIRQGCPPDATLTADHHGPRPADALTTRLEDLLRTSPGDRYEVLDHFTHTPSTFDCGTEVSTLLYDHHADSTAAPYRLFLEETDSNFEVYTVREGSFPTATAAHAWAAARDTPLPLAPTPHNTSTTATTAAERTTLARHTPLAMPPTAATTPQPPPGRPRRPRGGQ